VPSSRDRRRDALIVRRSRDCHPRDGAYLERSHILCIVDE
jgi:hypothetical protein